jgi:protoheme ferro-lyase
LGRFRLTDENDNLLSILKFTFFVFNILLIILWLVFKIPYNYLFYFEAALIIISVSIFILVYFFKEIISNVKNKIKEHELAKEIGWENVKKQKEEQANRVIEEINDYCEKMGIDLAKKYVDPEKEERKTRIKRFFN